ncbi:tetratricopeptide repeat protein 36 homolog [Anthonomus grandis grandis]|uniref:tetratricopeptide repeat protein 36 homolog n=1 Tax=Anthonomus grandis grandis TaxID=2921223 RepID=UPI0021661A32|nr:tetratricopeptide repeat protein 36 homolog [Anthonomus grandis grandis]
MASSELSAHDRAVLNCVFNPNLPVEESEQAEPTDNEDLTPETLTTKKMELEAIKLAEKGRLREALSMLNRALEIAPRRPSLYNNRAHVYQYLRQFEAALDDLTESINLCTEKHRKTLCHAYCQRGVLHKRAKRTEMAREDFERAARLGSKFAKAQLVELNPYAALCNQMLLQVMEKLG